MKKNDFSAQAGWKEQDLTPGRASREPGAETGRGKGHQPECEHKGLGRVEGHPLPAPFPTDWAKDSDSSGISDGTNHTRATRGQALYPATLTVILGDLEKVPSAF